MTGKRKRVWDSEPDNSTTVVVPCKKDRGGDEEDDSNKMLKIMLPSVATSCVHPITQKKEVIAVVLLPSATKDAKIDVSVDESIAGTFTAQCALATTFTDP